MLTSLRVVVRGVEYPIHPLDLTRIIEVELPINGKNVNSSICTGFIQPAGQSCGDGCDLIMGDVFLRNTVASYVYLTLTSSHKFLIYLLPLSLYSFNFGQDTNTDEINDGSFVRVAPLTQFADAWSDFINTRTANLKMLAPEPPIDVLQGILGSNSSSSSSNSSSPGSDGASKFLADDLSSSTDDGSSSRLVSLVEKYGPVIIGLLAGNILIGVALVAIGLMVCMRRGSEKTRSVSPTYAPVRFKEADSGVDTSYHD
jgi:saccharopepsin